MPSQRLTPGPTPPATVGVDKVVNHDDNIELQVHALKHLENQELLEHLEYLEVLDI